MGINPSAVLWEDAIGSWFDFAHHDSSVMFADMASLSTM